MPRAAPYGIIMGAALLATECEGHGHITWPPARNGGTLARAGSCDRNECMWFSQPAVIPGPPTVNAPQFRTYNVHVGDGGARDWSKEMPWRAPGTSPVFGSGCGAAGGGPVPMDNGGTAPPGMQGEDMLDALPPRADPTVWRRGAVEEAAWAITANHGGGYSWRLCNKKGNVSEACFQRTVLRFAGEKQYLRYGEQYQYDTPLGGASAHGRKAALPDFEIPLVRVTEGTHPKGSEWARNPVPGCNLCNQADCTGTWFEVQQCAQSCSGLNLTACPGGLTQFPEPLPGVSGYTGPYVPQPLAFPFSIVDKVVVPADIEPGAYLLSWRWDCEQSKQIWQNCADIIVQ